MSIAALLQELINQRNHLADHLVMMGVSAERTETLNSLVPKVLQIQNGGLQKQPLFFYGSDAPEKYGDKVFTIYQNGIQDISGYIRNNRQFCSVENNYALSYNQTDFGWDGQVYTASIEAFTVNSETSVVFCYSSGFLESGSLFLIPTSGKSEKDTVQNYIFTSLNTQNYVEVPFYWLQCSEFITQMIQLDAVPNGEYYLCWLGRSDNTHPVMRGVTIYGYRRFYNERILDNDKARFFGTWRMARLFSRRL